MDAINYPTNDRHAIILSQLVLGEHTSSSLAYILGCPEPSVRRDIQELRRAGHNISFAGTPSYVYRLRT